MKKLSCCLFFFLLICTATIVYAQGNIQMLELKSKVFHNTRSIRVLLPSGYHESKNSNRKYPVLYMNDGIATFHAYRIEKVMDSLISAQKIPPLIVVGIDNGGSSKEATNPLRDRANEYLPWSDIEERDSTLFLKNPMGKLYPDFLVREVMPLIESNFRVKKGWKNTALGGASYGALISLYTHLNAKREVGLLLLESPSLYVNNKAVLKLVDGIAKHTKVYIGIGTKEGSNAETQNMAVNDAATLARKCMVACGSENVFYYVDDGAGHNFEAFTGRFPTALVFLFSK